MITFWAFALFSWCRVTCLMYNYSTDFEFDSSNRKLMRRDIQTLETINVRSPRSSILHTKTENEKTSKLRNETQLWFLERQQLETTSWASDLREQTWTNEMANCILFLVQKTLSYYDDFCATNYDDFTMLSKLLRINWALTLSKFVVGLRWMWKR